MVARARIAAVLLLGQGVGRGAQAIYAILMVRELSKSGYGDFAYVLAISGILLVVGDLGFSRLIIRDVARSEDAVRLVREMLHVRALGVIVVSATFVAIGAAGLLPRGFGLALAAAAYLLAEGFAYGYESAAIGSERPGRLVAVQTVAGLATIAAAMLVLLSDAVAPVGAMAGLAAGSVVKLATHRVVWRRGAATARTLGDLPIRQWMREALPLLFLALLATIYYRAGVVVLHALRGSDETAPFAAAMRVFDAFAVLGGVGFASVSPAISRLHRDRPHELWTAWKRMIGLTIVVAAPTTALLVIEARPLAGALFGLRYANSAGTVLAVLAPGMALAVLQTLSASIVLMSDDRRDVIRLTAMNVGGMLSMVIVFTLWEGAIGAAIAISAAELISFTTFALLIRRRYGARLAPRVRAT